VTLHLALVILSWIAAALQLTGVWFSGRKDIRCWPFWIAGSIGWMIFAGGEGQWAVFVLNLVFFIFNIHGWRSWLKERKQ
jgi:nicotinamide riboside transporter PnuC